MTTCDLVRDRTFARSHWRLLIEAVDRERSKHCRIYKANGGRWSSLDAKEGIALRVLSGYRPTRSGTISLCNNFSMRRILSCTFAHRPPRPETRVHFYRKPLVYRSVPVSTLRFPMFVARVSFLLLKSGNNATGKLQRTCKYRKCTTASRAKVVAGTVIIIYYGQSPFSAH
jgi:hypothetical protein